MIAFSESAKDFSGKQSFCKSSGKVITPSIAQSTKTFRWFVNKQMHAWENKTKCKNIFKFTSGSKTFSNQKV